MAIEKNIGKNTIGDNEKMKVYMHDYNMSTHDLSTITRTSISPGVLVPTMKLLVQKGDTIDIDIESNVLTHPTTGPLFGSFKLENHIYFGAMRLYNSWLHNNRTKIGLNMSQIKLPKISVTLNSVYGDNPTSKNQWTQINPSCVLAYLGLKGYGNLKSVNSKLVEKNGVPLLMYYDIFKNYYANTQEENFYTIGSSTKLTVTINGDTIENPDNIPNTLGEITSASTITLAPKTELTKDEIRFSVKTNINARTVTMKVDELGDWDSSGNAIRIETTGVLSTWYVSAIYSTKRTSLNKWKLEDLDILKDHILQTPGNTTFVLTAEKNIQLLQSFAQRNRDNTLKTTTPQYGLCLKTYNSDIYQNWINAEWIEGVQGINEISAVDVSDGKLSMDALNLAQKVYNMLNRIVVSGGTYRDWLETVYTGGNYFERCETPIFEGGTSQEIVFQEVVSNSASQDEPLGTLAGRGVTTGKQRGGHIKIKVTEPCYIMCICSITPRIDYGQGNTWAYRDWETDRKSTRLNSSHITRSRMPSSA